MIGIDQESDESDSSQKDKRTLVSLKPKTSFEKKDTLQRGLEEIMELNKNFESEIDNLQRKTKERE